VFLALRREFAPRSIGNFELKSPSLGETGAPNGIGRSSGSGAGDFRASQRTAASFAVKQVDNNVPHDRTPLFINERDGGRGLFQDVFVVPGKWFRALVDAV
jgi:hypothetical protein